MFLLRSMYILELNKKNLGLSIAEAVNTLKPKKYSIIDDYLIIEGFGLKKTIKKINLGLTKTIKQVILTSATTNDLKIELTKTNLSKHYKKDFKVECQGFGKDNDVITKTLGSIIFKQLNKPKVNINNPTTLFSCIKTKKRIFFTILLWKNNDDVRDRKNKELPERMPTTLNPEIAKAMINLSGKRKGKLIDPFCGAGGILIEAARFGFNVTGYDIDKRAIGKAKLNLLHLGMKNIHLERRDALTINKKYDCIITDLPFGKNSKISKEIDNLYVEFLTKALKYTKKIVVGFPGTFNRDLIPKQWKVIDFFELYVHKSMSKIICVLKK
jgi:tRNA (guanine10-N2)-dimethyltransferase